MPKRDHGPICVEIYRSGAANPKQRYRWRAISHNGRKIANSGEGYVRIFDAVDMAAFVVGPPDDDLVVEYKSTGIVRKTWWVTK